MWCKLLIMFSSCAIILLGLLGTASAQSTFPVYDKPGICPEPSGVGACLRSCLNDGQCRGELKCCSNGCGSECLKPVFAVPPKPGLCPNPINYNVCDMQQCNYDYNCSEAMKCCPTPCGGRVCAPPVWSLDDTSLSEKPYYDRPGVCPEPSGVGPCVSSCDGDVDCREGFKCCGNGCGVECVRAQFGTPPRPGVCPDPIGYGVCTLSSCNYDYNCTGEQKCCPTPCGGRLCVDPLPESLFVKPGVCPRPVFSDTDECPVTKVWVCSRDDHCPGDLKCCHNGCRNVCLEPAAAGEKRPACQVRVGSCPFPAFNATQCPLVDFMSCAGDAACGGGEKCCYNGCGFSCVKPFRKPGGCPTVRPVECALCPRIDFWCSSDDCCGGDLKCCDNGCGTSCVKPVDLGQKSGLCPAPSEVPTSPSLLCDERECGLDAECPGELKCCANSCGGRVCSPPIFV